MRDKGWCKFSRNARNAPAEAPAGSGWWAAIADASVLMTARHARRKVRAEMQNEKHGVDKQPDGEDVKSDVLQHELQN